MTDLTANGAVSWTRPGAAWHIGDHGRPDSVRTQEALFFSETAEHIPAFARAHDWETPRFKGNAALRAEAARLSGCANGLRPAVDITSTRLVVAPDGCEGPIVLPQFYFPGWVAAANAPPLQPDPKTGLISIAAPYGTEPLVYERRPLPQERLGAAVSIAGLAAWIVLVTLAFPARLGGGYWADRFRPGRYRATALR